jgi:signal transduction histidine kinase/CheY-like chemotaxis protein
MPPKDLHLLLVEDSSDDATLLQQALRQAGMTLVLRQVDSAAAMAAALIEQPWDLVVSDYNLPGFSGTDALQLLREHALDTPFIVVSGCIGEEAAVTLMKAGADDYVMKDNLARLAPAVERSLKEVRTRVQRQIAELALRESEARFKAIASNIPGTVLQLQLDANGSWSFGYVSEGCLALLGVTPQLLQRNPGFFFDLIAPEDSAAFAQSMQTSARDLTDWNWEGRIHVGGSDEVKWVNLRSSPRRLDDGSVLWEGILSNITQNKLAELEVRRSREQLSSLSAHIQSVKERERTRIAREIHDDLGGTLTAIKIELMRLGKDLAPGADQALQHLRSTEALVDSALDMARRISTELRPGILDLGIVAAIEWQSAEFQKRMDMPCLVTCAQEDIPLEDEISIALFRIFQETLTNIAKHAGASQVDVILDASEDRVSLVVSDNGRGLADADLSNPNAFGIRGMQERALNLGGEASVYRTPGGTTVMVSVPRSIAAATQSPADDELLLLFGRATSSGGPDLRSPTIRSSVPAPAPGGKPDTKGMGTT